MASFFGIRLARHSKKMMKYMRYVLNDHFLLVCIFLLGGLGFYYSQLLKSLPENFIWGRPIILLVWLASLHMGRLVTLAEEADKVFLLPKETKLSSYFNRALRYSIWLPFAALFLINGLLMPLLVVSTGWDFSTFFYYIGILFCLKTSHLFLQKYELYQTTSRQYIGCYCCWLAATVLILTASVYLTPWVGLLAAILMGLATYILVQKQASSLSLDWEKMIQKEQNRMHRIYQFIHLFTDVPEITSSVKRRKWLDPFVNRIKKVHQNTYLYLYIRNFMRGSDYSGLFLRLVLVAGVILFFLKEFWIALGVSLLFIYLIGFQLIPIYTQFDYMSMIRLYPVSNKQKIQAVRQLITALLVVAAFVFSLFVFIALPDKKESLFISIMLFVEVIAFVKLYVPYRLKKMEG